MNKKWFTFLLLIGIILLGALLRVYQLGEAPSGLYSDEASIGYNAYSIFTTGKDEFGKSWPTVFRSFTDFKTPIYIYLTAPIIGLFDLSTLSVRLLSFSVGVVTIPILFLLLKEIGKPYQYINQLSLVASFLLAISPWHILFSRSAFEANIALCLFLTGIYFFYLGLRKPVFLVASAFLLAIAMLSYHAERFLVPLTLIALWIRHYKLLLTKRYRNYKIAGVFIGVLILIPTLMIVTTPGFIARAAGLNILSGHQVANGTIQNYHGGMDWIVNGQWFLSTKEFFSLYTAYYSLRNMFWMGDYDLRVSYPELATFYLWQMPFYIGGILSLVKRSGWTELRFLLIFLLLTAPIPAALTRDPYTTIRALPLLMPQIVLIALGLIEMGKWFQPKRRWMIGSLVGGMIFYSVLQWYSSAIVLNETYRTKEWNGGLQEVAQFIHPTYQTLPTVFDDSRLEVYSQLAFFLKADPRQYQADNFEVNPSDYYTSLNRMREKKIGQITTRPINWERDLKIDQYLIGDELAISYDQIQHHRLTLEKEVRYPDNSIAFRIVRTNPEYEKSKLAQ